MYANGGFALSAAYPDDWCDSSWL